LHIIVFGLQDPNTPEYVSDDAEEDNDAAQPPIGDDGEEDDMDTPIMHTGDGVCEDDIRRAQKMNTVAALAALRLQPANISRHMIPLCRLVVMPMVRPTLQCDLIKLEQEFVHGYREGACVFYISLTNEQGQGEHVTEKHRSLRASSLRATSLMNTLTPKTPCDS
jgi:hypothetical protein